MCQLMCPDNKVPFTPVLCSHFSPHTCSSLLQAGLGSRPWGARSRSCWELCPWTRRPLCPWQRPAGRRAAPLQGQSSARGTSPTAATSGRRLYCPTLQAAGGEGAVGARGGRAAAPPWRDPRTLNLADDDFPLRRCHHLPAGDNLAASGGQRRPTQGLRGGPAHRHSAGPPASCARRASRHQASSYRRGGRRRGSRRCARLASE